MNRKQLAKLTFIYSRDLEFINADIMKWNHDQGSAQPPSREALFGLALLYCKDASQYLSNFYEWELPDNEPPEKELIPAFKFISRAEGIMLSLGFYSFSAIRNAHKKALLDDDEEVG